MLLELRISGHERDYFARQKEFAAAERWYKELGSGREKN
jgi:hypothetical protein